MKYKQIVQELRESQDMNVQLFLLDAEKIIKLPRKVTKGMLSQLQKPGVIDTLVKNYIPTIIRIAYQNSLLMNSVSFLDLVEEGVLGAYKCLNKYKNVGTVSDKVVRAMIIGTIKRLVCKKECPFSVCQFDENDPRLYQMNKMYGSYNTKTAMPEMKKEKSQVDRFEWVRNMQGIRVKKCCASCAHKDLTRAVSKRYCSISGNCVDPLNVCESWEMSEQMKIAGLLH